MLCNKVGHWLCSAVGQGHQLGFLVGRGLQLYLVLEIVIHVQVGSLSRFPCQVKLQAMLCDWVRSLSGSPSWGRLQVVFNNQVGPWFRLCCRQGLKAGLPSCPVSLFRLLCFVGPKFILNSWPEQLAWLPAKQDYRMYSTAAQVFWPCFLIGLDQRIYILNSWEGL